MITDYYNGFDLSVESINSHSLWFCFTTLCDWLVKLARLSQPMANKTRTNRALLTAFSRAWGRLHVFSSSSDWLIALFTWVIVIVVQSNYFGFGFTTQN